MAMDCSTPLLQMTVGQAYNCAAQGTADAAGKLTKAASEWQLGDILVAVICVAAAFGLMLAASWFEARRNRRKP